MYYMKSGYRPSFKRLFLLYTNGKSMMEIASILRCSVYTIVYWMNKYDIQRRTRSDAAYVRANPRGDPFTIKMKRTGKEQLLFGLGLGIYWGEGNKVTTHTLRVANTDASMIKVFVRFLKIICGLPGDKIHYSIVTFNDADPAEVRRYWAKQLEISRDKFGTIVTIPPQGKGKYRKKSRFGVCTVTVGNIKLKRWIMGELEKIKTAWIV
jgi:hypothetical protein